MSTRLNSFALVRDVGIVRVLIVVHLLKILAVCDGLPTFHHFCHLFWLFCSDVCDCHGPFSGVQSRCSENCFLIPNRSVYTSGESFFRVRVCQGQQGAEK